MSDAFEAIGESRYSGKSGISPRSMSRSSSQTTSCVRPMANDGTSSTPPASDTIRMVSARIRIDSASGSCSRPP